VLTKRASAALSSFQTKAKTTIVDAIDLKVHHVHELQTKSVVDGIAQLASVFMTFYDISSTNATADPMVKYHLLNAIAHKDFDTLFLSTGVSRSSSSTARQTDNICQAGHFGSEESYEHPKTNDL